MSSGYPILNNRGRYKCPFCNHKTWKQYGSAMTHIDTKHAVEKQEAINRELREQNNRLIRENRELKQRPAAPPPRKEEKPQQYSATIYCSNCKQVWGALIPVGCKVEEAACFNCGTRSWHRVIKINTWKVEV